MIFTKNNGVKIMNNEDYINFKISPDKYYKVYKSTKNGRDFYNLLIEQKNMDGSKIKYYKLIQFKRGLTPPIDNSIIRIKKGIENYYGDNKFKPESIILVLDYEVKLNEEQIERQAFEDFNNTDEVKIDDTFLD